MLKAQWKLSLHDIDLNGGFGCSFHCCYKYAEEYYDDWFTSKECRQYALLHPIKLRGPLWQQ